MLNVTVDWLRDYLLRKFCVHVNDEIWISRNRKRGTPLIGYAIHVTRKISIHVTAP